MSAQAIAGVSPNSESRMMTEFPSVGAMGIGRVVGQLMDSIPVRIFGVKLSYLIFGLPLAPVGALLFLLRLLGPRYVLTNRSIQTWSTMGSGRSASVDLNEIADVEIEVLPGQQFFRAADLKMKSANGQTLLRLAGVADAAAFRTVIQKAIQARRLVQSTLTTINNRK